MDHEETLVDLDGSTIYSVGSHGDSGYLIGCARIERGDIMGDFREGNLNGK